MKTPESQRARVHPETLFSDVILRSKATKNLIVKAVSRDSSLHSEWHCIVSGWTRAKWTRLENLVLKARSELHGFAGKDWELLWRFQVSGVRCQEKNTEAETWTLKSWDLVLGICYFAIIMRICRRNFVQLSVRLHLFLIKLKRRINYAIFTLHPDGNVLFCICDLCWQRHY